MQVHYFLKAVAELYLALGWQVVFAVIVSIHFAIGFGRLLFASAHHSMVHKLGQLLGFKLAGDLGFFGTIRVL